MPAIRCWSSTPASSCGYTPQYGELRDTSPKHSLETVEPADTRVKTAIARAFAITRRADLAGINRTGQQIHQLAMKAVAVAAPVQLGYDAMGGKGLGGRRKAGNERGTS